MHAIDITAEASMLPLAISLSFILFEAEPFIGLPAARAISLPIGFRWLFFSGLPSPRLHTSSSPLLCIDLGNSYIKNQAML